MDHRTRKSGLDTGSGDSVASLRHGAEVRQIWRPKLTLLHERIVSCEGSCDDHSKDFDTVVRLSYERIHRYCLKLTKNSHDASDVTQEVFLRAFKTIGRQWKGDNPERWLMKIALHCFLDFRRKRLACNVTSFESLCTELYPYDPMDTSLNPEDTYFRDKYSERLMKALMNLSEEQRVLLH